MKKNTKQNLGFPSIGIGIILIIIAIASFIESSPVLYSTKENFIFIGFGLLLILFGLFLTWPSNLEALNSFSKNDQQTNQDDH